MITGFRQSRTSPRPRISLAAALIAMMSISMTAGVQAAPTPAAPPTPQNPQRQLDALQYRMTQATEDYNVARVQLRASQAKAAAVRRQMVDQRAKVDALQAEVDGMAAAAYRGGNLTKLNSVLSAAGPQVLLDQLSILDQLSKGQRARLTALSTAQQKLEVQRKTIEKELTVQTAREQTLRSKKNAIEADLVKARTLAAAAAGQAERSSRSRRGSPSTQSFPMPAIGSGRGAIAVRFALSQMGKPYVWGADGPGSYDCSGLTMRAWQAAGVNLPHSSRMQYSSSPRVSRSQLRPGDLVFSYSPISHVGIYVGGDTLIAAPRSGDVVKYQTIRSLSFAGATRPG